MSEHPATSEIRIRGRIHRENGEACEDVTLIRREGTFLFLGVADGQSAAAFGAEGGRACLETVTDYIKALGVEQIRSAPFPDELPSEIVKCFRKRLLALAESRGADYRSFASTLLVFAVDLQSGGYVLAHLGDGCAVSVSREGEVSQLSAAENGLVPGSTWLTTSAVVIPHLRLAFGSLAGKKRVLLMTDGAASLCAGRVIPRRTKELISTATAPELERHLADSDPADDASCIVLDL